MKKVLLFVVCVFVLIGCTSSKKSNNNNAENESTTSGVINYISETALTQSVVGDTEDDYPVYEYELSQPLKSASICVYEKENEWEKQIISYEDDIYSHGQIAIFLGDETYDIYLIHSETENNIIKYNFSQHYLESLNSNKVMFANTLDNKKIEANEEIVLFTVLGKKDNPIDPPNPENFTKENCDYGIEVTITFHDTKQAPRSE